MTTALLPIVAAAVSALGTWGARRYALARRLIDEPGERRSHVVATPRGGGIGPVLGILLAVLAGGWGALVAAGVLGVAAIGAWDDHRPLPASRRLVVHAAAAALVAAALHPPAEAPVAFALAWFAGVALTNVWNFMDGIDGLASTQAVIAALALAALAGGATAHVGIAVAAACAAFVPFNFPRARIFMGDVGSGALGLTVAALAATSADATPEGALRASLPLSAFLVDAGLTLARRMLRRERWWEAHSQHLYQALARRFGHARVTLAYAGWTVAATLVALRSPDAFMMAAWTGWYIGGAVLWLVLQRRAASERGDRREKDR